MAGSLDCVVMQCCADRDRLEFAGKDWLQAPRVGVMSLVYRNILADGNPTRSLDFIHWDDIGQKVGRLVRVEGKLVSYTLPKDKQSFAEDDLEFILANTCLQMVRCKGIFRPEMPDYIFRLKERYTSWQVGPPAKSTRRSANFATEPCVARQMAMSAH